MYVGVPFRGVDGARIREDDEGWTWGTRPGSTVAGPRPTVARHPGRCVKTGRHYQPGALIVRVNEPGLQGWALAD